MSSPLLTSTPSVLPPAQNELRAVGRIEQLDQLTMVNDRQQLFQEMHRASKEHNLQTERAYRGMVDCKVGDSRSEGEEMPEDETITNNLGDTTNHYYPQVAKAASGLGKLAATAGISALAGGGLAGGAMLLLGSLLGGDGKEQSAAPVANQAAKIELYYDDPVKGLIPLSGAASKEGATVKE